MESKISRKDSDGKNQRFIKPLLFLTNLTIIFLSLPSSHLLFPIQILQVRVCYSLNRFIIHHLYSIIHSRIYTCILYLLYYVLLGYQRMAITKEQNDGQNRYPQSGSFNRSPRSTHRFKIVQNSRYQYPAFSLYAISQIYLSIYLSIHSSSLTNYPLLN